LFILQLKCDTSPFKLASCKILLHFTHFEIGFSVNLINEYSEKLASSLNFDRVYLFLEHEQVKKSPKEKERKNLIRSY
jgi:hypothetical protein